MNKWAACDLFLPMRSSTPQEQKIYEKMLNKCSIPMKESIGNMSEIEIDYCDICHKKTQVQRQYYYYNINCKCCNGDHFEIIRYCKDCKPKPPKYISAIVIPKELQNQKSMINPEYGDYYD